MSHGRVLDRVAIGARGEDMRGPRVNTTYHRQDPFAEFGLRVVAIWARRNGSSVQRVDDVSEYSKQGTDLIVERSGRMIKVKVKADSYFGTGSGAIDDHDLPYYRRRSDDVALETVSHHLTREPGWMFSSEADELWYYQAALLNTRGELERALTLDDEGMVAAVDVEVDRLRVMDMQRLRQWFDGAHVNYPPRPVQTGDHLAWFRIIPPSDIVRAIGTIETHSRVVGSA